MVRGFMSFAEHGPILNICSTISVPLTKPHVATNSAAAATAPRRPVVQMPDEYLPPNKILFLQNLPTDVRQDQLIALFGQYPGLAEVRMIPTKKDIAFVEFVDETTAGVAKDALHNYKLDGENKIKVRTGQLNEFLPKLTSFVDHFCKEITYACAYSNNGGSSEEAESPDDTIINYVHLQGKTCILVLAVNVKQIFQTRS